MLDFFFFFFNDTATTEIYTLSLHDALPIYSSGTSDDDTVMLRLSALTIPLLTLFASPRGAPTTTVVSPTLRSSESAQSRSEEHTSELQSRQYLVCRLLLEKKKNKDHRSSST